MQFWHIKMQDKIDHYEPCDILSNIIIFHTDDQVCLSSATLIDITNDILH